MTLGGALFAERKETVITMHQPGKDILLAFDLHSILHPWPD